MVTKKQKLEHLQGEKLKEKERILDVMRKADIYTITLDSLIDLYLDAHEIYVSKYEAWKALGFPETKRHTNKAGATNATKHPLAQQVETWSLKKAKYLEMLGLTNKQYATNRVVGGGGKKDELEKPPEQTMDELEEHRKKWRVKS
ncbi:P27 family phage terminase small subunit [Listeria monocytogenes]|nr:P27 family phage terminase small subunit [Listeria monocytogenes]